MERDILKKATAYFASQIPLLFMGEKRAGVNLGIRSSLADIGQTVAENFGLSLQAGRSFFHEISLASWLDCA